MGEINKIVIVGGGSAGWLTSAFLIKTFPDKDITLIESPSVPTVGVGESTLADITNFRDYLGIDEREFMRATNASYKMSIKFTDFYNVDSGGFHYPFRYPYLEGTVNGLSDWLEIKAAYPETPAQDFVRCYFPHAALFEQNKYSLNLHGKFGNYNPKTDVAYHFDAAKFAEWLRDGYCLPRGVKYVSATIADAKLSEEGINSLVLDSGEEVTADLFIDCTGFRSMLLAGYMQEPFKSLEHMLPNNRAWATQIPYEDKEKEIEPFTNGTAIENGWCWNIPLWSRLGTGYVYSDKFVDPEDAKEEFKKYLMSNKMVVPRTREQVDALTFKDIRMRVGIHERLWVKNVVAIGLSAGFIEPLESNGLFSVTTFLKYLAKSLLRNHVTQFDKDVFNTACQAVFKNFSEFVGLHYALSVRTDTEYWRAINKKVFNPGMIHLEPVTSTGFFDAQNKKMFTGVMDNLWGISYISVGYNYPFFDSVDQRFNTHGADVKPYVNRNVERFNLQKKAWKKAAENEPSLYQYLRDHVHDD
jgi:tryptophan halogenase